MNFFFLDCSSVASLEFSFSEEEIFTALKDSDGHKAPSLNEFSF